VGINIVGNDRGMKRIPEPHSIVSFLNFLFNFERLRTRLHQNRGSNRVIWLRFLVESRHKMGFLSRVILEAKS